MTRFTHAGAWQHPATPEDPAPAAPTIDGPCPRETRTRRTAARPARGVYLERETTLGVAGTVASTTVPVTIYLVALYGSTPRSLGPSTCSPLLLLAGTAAVLVLSVALAAAGAGVTVCLVVLMFAPVTVLGYETLGHRHVEEALGRCAGGRAEAAA